MKRALRKCVADYLARAHGNQQKLSAKEVLDMAKELVQYQGKVQENLQ